MSRRSRWILAIDQGTTSTRAILFDDHMHVAGIAQREFAQHYPASGWVEHEADDLWETSVATVREGAVLDDDEHIVVGTAGHVDHGKSTLVGSLVTGQPDDGEGGTRSYLDVQPHEIERGLSADLSYGVYGFVDGEPARVDDPTRKGDRAAVVADADRLVSFVDTVGHEPWLRTTIRGLVGQKLDYGLLTVAADDGPTETPNRPTGETPEGESIVYETVSFEQIAGDRPVQSVPAVESNPIAEGEAAWSDLPSIDLPAGGVGIGVPGRPGGDLPERPEVVGHVVAEDPPLEAEVDGEWRKLARIRDNPLRLLTIAFEPLQATALRLTLERGGTRSRFTFEPVDQVRELRGDRQREHRAALRALAGGSDAERVQQVAEGCVTPGPHQPSQTCVTRSADSRAAFDGASPS